MLNDSDGLEPKPSVVGVQPGVLAHAVQAEESAAVSSSRNRDQLHQLTAIALTVAVGHHPGDVTSRVKIIGVGPEIHIRPGQGGNHNMFALDVQANEPALVEKPINRSVSSSGPALVCLLGEAVIGEPDLGLIAHRVQRGPVLITAAVEDGNHASSSY